MPESFKEYTELVCKQLRWKKAQSIVKQEIEAHLFDQRDALVKNGMDEDSANRESIRQMGDAVEIGTELDRVHRPKSAWGMFALTALLAFIGVFINVVFAVNSSFMLQLIYSAMAILPGTGCLLGAYFLDFTIIGKHPLLIYFSAALLASVLCLIPGLQMMNGKCYYAQFVLLLFPLAFAALLYRLHGKKYIGLFLTLAGMAFLSICCLIVPSIGGLAVTVFSAFALMIVAAAEDWFSIGRAQSFVIIGIAALITAILLLLAIISSNYLTSRVIAAFNPWSDPLRTGWEGIIARELISGARFVGCSTSGGFGKIDINSNFMLNHLIYNIGWISFIVIMAAFAAFLVCGFRLCFKQKNMLGKLVSFAVMQTLALQTAFYVATNLGFNLIYSISLPLVSYGNTATIVNMALIGVMLSAFRTGSLVRDGALGCQSTTSKRLRWKNGELTISFKRHIAS